MTRSPLVRLQYGTGALVGAAVGDALGAPFEFRSGGLWSDTFPAPVLGGTGEMRPGGPWAAGEFTDDTQMAVVLAESLLARDGLDPDHLWLRWQAWAADAADVGVLTRYALGEPGPGGAAMVAMERNGGQAAGNGGIMRNTPVALFTAHEPVEVAAALAAAQSDLTHADPDAAVGAALHVRMVRAGIDGDDMFAVLDDAVAALTGAEIGRWGPLLAPDWSPSDRDLTNGTVWTCLAQAVWAVRRARSFAEAVTLAVDLGDDADTVACVAGSLAGARWGVQAIPSRWTTYVHGRVRHVDGHEVRLRNADLQDLARRLMGHRPVRPTGKEPAKAAVRVHDALPLYAADWGGAAQVPTDWAVVSACRTGTDFLGHPVRREVYLIDSYDAADQHDPLGALTDAVDAIDALLAEAPERDLVVHCHGGRSRTALLLTAWAMRHHGWSVDEAFSWLSASWPHAHLDNPVFRRLLHEDWPPR